jgi:hypothetical protein
LDLAQWGIVIAAGLLMVLIVEIVKAVSVIKKIKREKSLKL